MARSYSREEVQAILGRALERQHASAERDGLSHDELIAVGKELGVPTDAIESAAVEVDGELETTRAVDDRIKRMRRALGSHLLSFVLVNALLAVINLTLGGPLWFLWSVLGWGIGLAFHARAAISPDREKLTARTRQRLERDRKRRLEREQREREREEDRARREALKKSAKRVERAVTEGVERTLRAVADALDTPADSTKEDPRVRVDAETGPKTRAADAEEPSAEQEEEQAPKRRAR